MFKSAWDHRYGPYPKKKEKKHHFRGAQFLERSYEWLKWKNTYVGDSSFHRPCMEH